MLSGVDILRFLLNGKYFINGKTSAIVVWVQNCLSSQERLWRTTDTELTPNIHKIFGHITNYLLPDLACSVCTSEISYLRFSTRTSARIYGIGQSIVVCFFTGSYFCWSFFRLTWFEWSGFLRWASGRVNGSMEWFNHITLPARTWCDFYEKQ